MSPRRRPRITALRARAFATRDLSGHKLLYLFVDGVAERKHRVPEGSSVSFSARPPQGYPDDQSAGATLPGGTVKVIANAFGERPVLKLMCAALTRATAQWRGIKVTAFERKQGDVIQEQLEAEPGGRHASQARRSRGPKDRAVR